MLIFSRGARYMMLSALGFSFMGAFVKTAHLQGIPVLEIIAARALTSIVLSLIDIKRKNVSILGRRKGLLLMRGLVGTLALMCVYGALVSLPFAEATVLQYLYPFFTAVLALLFLGERLQKATIIGIFISFTGVMCIVRPAFLFGVWDAEYTNTAVLLALLGALGSAMAYVLVRKLNETEVPSVIVLYFPLIALPLSLLLLGSDFVMPQGWTWGVLLMVGITTQVGQIALTKAMQTETAAKASSFAYIQVVFATLLGWYYFNEIPTVWTALGSALIVFAAIYTARAKT